MVGQEGLERPVGAGSGLTGRVRLLWRVLIAAWASAWVWNFTKAQPRESKGEEERMSAHL